MMDPNAVKRFCSAAIACALAERDANEFFRREEKKVHYPDELLPRISKVFIDFYENRNDILDWRDDIEQMIERGDVRNPELASRPPRMFAWLETPVLELDRIIRDLRPAVGQDYLEYSLGLVLLQTVGIDVFPSLGSLRNAFRDLGLEEEKRT